ncbi:putative late blight resistance protein homolog R1A-10 [Salvia miltiorrhiza]|uniref:putative late blight resistance protein homolog R1A-10 n=1 Tax=Salvia miltiorrhiza TaxID=226208 RepID=UPI0025AC3666|nr:putative late blight resistance protein homolog R1A-10 [Salvia miltiorrhiza]
MAAYAALVSLLNTVDNIQNHPHLSHCFLHKQIQTLTAKLDSLLAFVEKYTSQSHGELESQIASASHAAEDAIESHIVDHILAGSAENTPPSLLDLQKSIQEMDSIEEKLKAETRSEDLQPTYSTPAPPSTEAVTARKSTTMVGFEEYWEEVMDKLTSDQRQRQIIPITGMGGIGKTTLARNVYENATIVQCFDVRGWVTVSQDYSVRKILFEILSSLGESTREMDERTEYELSEKLHKTLFGRKYLVVLDDIWSIDAWKRVQFFLPDNYNKSRMIVTTRQSDVAKEFSDSALVLQLLGEDESWELFCHKAFGQRDCPSELEGVGREIVRRCKGLPLSVAVIGGLLRRSSMTRSYWEIVAEDISSALDSAGDSQYQNLLSLSYSYLPACLKPCFLYLGIYPEDHEFRVSRLIKLWIAEGLLKPNKEQNLEEIARGFIKDLVDRNLILVCSLGSNGKLKTCRIHDLLRDICIRVVEKEKFLSIITTRVHDAPRDMNMERRIVNHGRYSPGGVLDTLESTSLARSLIFQSPALLPFKSRMMRVLVEAYGDSLAPTFQQVNLRLLAYESVRAPFGWIRTYELPPSVSLLWNVQTLIVDRSIDKVVAPSEIWEMQQLRHLEFYRIWLPDPPPSEGGCVLQNLRTVKTALDFKCSEEVCKRTPNIRKLKIFYQDFSEETRESSHCLHNICSFNRLESLSCCFHTVPNHDVLLQSLKFPSSLKKLVLQYCELHWDDLTIIGALPHLEVLKLKYQAVRGHEWCPVEEGFARLKFLEVDSCYLIKWDADDSCFPVLETLVLGGLYKLDEIPADMADIATLQRVCVVECSVSAAISALRILEQKLENEEDDLRVRIGFREKAELEEFKEKVKFYDLSDLSFQVDRL